MLEKVKTFVKKHEKAIIGLVMILIIFAGAVTCLA